MSDAGAVTGAGAMPQGAEDAEMAGIASPKVANMLAAAQRQRCALVAQLQALQRANEPQQPQPQPQQPQEQKRPHRKQHPHQQPQPQQPHQQPPQQPHQHQQQPQYAQEAADVDRKMAGAAEGAPKAPWIHGVSSKCQPQCAQRLPPQAASLPSTLTTTITTTTTTTTTRRTTSATTPLAHPPASPSQPVTSAFERFVHSHALNKAWAHAVPVAVPAHSFDSFDSPGLRALPVAIGFVL